MKILITGASGFIGRYVVDELLKTDHTLIIAGRTNITDATTIPADKIIFKNLDLDNIDSTYNYYQHLNEPDILIHLAWQGLPNYTQLFHFEENLPGHYQFIKNLVTNGLQAVTVTGTCFEYGMRQGELTEDMPCVPDNAYALAKYTLYRFLTELKKQTPFLLTWLRLFYMYGAGQSPNSLFSQLVAALQCGDNSFNMSGGEQVRDFLPVEKVAEIIVTAALQKTDTGVINCCSGVPIKVKDWVNWFLETQHKHIQLNLGHYPYATYEPMAFWGGTEKLKIFSKK
jgi:nucleoside-diphosphate-sugar epimerase